MTSTDYQARLARLQRHIGFLIADADFRGTTYYAVDFSEVHAFVTPDLDEHPVVLGLIADTDIYTIALNRLFKGFAKPVYLLPPHVEELTAYASYLRGQARAALEYREQARKVIETLSATDRQRLVRLHAGKERHVDDLQFVTELVKGKFARFCADVAKYRLALTSAGSALKTLELMVGEGQLNIDLGIPGIEPSELGRMVRIEDLELVSRAFPGPREHAGRDDVHGQATRAPSHQEKRKGPLAKHRDAKGMLWLREINRRLRDRGDRLLLISRDLGIEEAGAALAQRSEFGWPEIACQVRGLQALYLDHLARADGDERIQEWLTRTRALLNDFEASLVRSAGRQELQQEILERAAQHWDQQANLRLSLLVRSEGALRPLTDKPRVSTEECDSDTFALIVRLWEFVNSQDYRDHAAHEIEAMWRRVQDDSLVLLFAEQLDRDEIDAVLRALRERVVGPDDAGFVQVETGPLAVCQLDFDDPRLQRTFRDLAELESTDARSRRSRVEELFREVIDLTVQRNRRAEGFLFMALMLAVQERWSDALRLARRAREVARRDGEVTHQFDYFVAFSARRLADVTQSPDEETVARLYEEAWEASDRGVKEKEDARYLKERGTVAAARRMRMEERGPASRSGGAAVSSAAPEWNAARRDLERALELPEVQLTLRMELLNNLAYMAVWEYPRALDEAEEFIEELDELVAASGARKKFAAIVDTEAWVEAMRAYDEDKPGGIRSAKYRLQTLLDSKSLSVLERRQLEVSVRRMDGLLSEFHRT